MTFCLSAFHLGVHRRGRPLIWWQFTICTYVTFGASHDLGTADITVIIVLPFISEGVE